MATSAAAGFREEQACDWAVLEAGEVAGAAAGTGAAGVQALRAYTAALGLRRAGRLAGAQTVLERLVVMGAASLNNENLARAVLLLLEIHVTARQPEQGLLLAEAWGSRLIGSGAPGVRDILDQLRMRACLLARKPVPLPEACSLPWLFLRARHSYLNGDPRTAALLLGQYRKFLDKDGARQGRELWAPLNNNLGLLYLAMKKRNLSVKYMQQALREHALLVESLNKVPDSEMDPSLKTVVFRDRPLYVFNLGVSLLEADRPEDAFDCFVEAARHYPNNPRVWYRLADCCVKHYNRKDRQENAVRKIGSGPHAKLIPGSLDGDKYSISGESYAIPTLSLEFAALCLMNASTLLPYRDPPVEHFVDKRIYQANPSDPMNYKQYRDLRNSVLLMYSFVSLKLGDHATALEHSAALLAHSGSPGHCALAHLYSAEALISLDRIAEAIEHLNLTNIQKYTSKLSPASRDAIVFAVWFNSAVCHAIRGELQHALSMLHQLNSPRTLPFQLYLETCAGNTDNCRVLLRKFKRMSLT